MNSPIPPALQPAFPFPYLTQPDGGVGYGAAGISVRAHFALTILSGMVSNPKLCEVYSDTRCRPKQAVHLADDLLAVLDLSAPTPPTP